MKEMLQRKLGLMRTQVTAPSTQVAELQRPARSQVMTPLPLVPHDSTPVVPDAAKYATRPDMRPKGAQCVVVHPSGTMQNGQRWTPAAARSTVGLRPSTSLFQTAECLGV